jgi:hypothetical protein
MTNKVIGIFNDASEAQDAVDELLDMGIEENRIDMTDGGVSGPDGKVSSDEHDKGGNAISRFFGSLFGHDSDDAQKYTQTSSGKHIVAVNAASREEAEEVADIMDDCGAIDVNESTGTFDLTGSVDGQTTGTAFSGGNYNRNEDMSLGKENEVGADKVRVRSRIFESSAEDVRLRENTTRNDTDRSDNGGNYSR